MTFSLDGLPVELAFEILCLAATPEEQCNQHPPFRIYETARSMALVSHCVRRVIMPHLLRTVILNNQESLDLFVRTLHQQKALSLSGSRLSLNYTQHIRRVWSSGCWEPVFQQESLESSDLLSEVLSSSISIGLTFSSQHLLYNSLDDACQPRSRNWSCRRLTFAGHNPRWNPLTSTAQGQAFLRQVSHLTIWLPSDDALGSTMSSPISPPDPMHLNLGARIPNWIKRVPFELMPNLTHFAFTLTRTPHSISTKLVVYSHRQPQPALRSPEQEQEQSKQPDSAIFREWATSADPLSYGKVVDVEVALVPFEGDEEEQKRWSLAFLRSDIGV